MTNFEKVGLFMTTFGQEVKKKPSLSTDKINNLRIKLIEEELNEIKTELINSDDLDIESVIKIGKDYEEIVKYSNEISADLIVIATHGRTGVLHTLLGSVAEKVIRYAKCPVLVTTPTEDDL